MLGFRGMRGGIGCGLGWWRIEFIFGGLEAQDLEILSRDHAYLASSLISDSILSVAKPLRETHCG